MKKLAIVWVCAATLILCLAADPAFTVDANHPSGKVSPMLYGLMTEEINHSYDGGLYAELIRNRAFLDDATAPVHWSVLNEHGAEATIALDSANPAAPNTGLKACSRISTRPARKPLRMMHRIRLPRASELREIFCFRL